MAAANSDMVQLYVISIYVKMASLNIFVNGPVTDKHLYEPCYQQLSAFFDNTDKNLYSTSTALNSDLGIKLSDFFDPLGTNTSKATTAPKAESTDAGTIYSNEVDTDNVDNTGFFHPPHIYDHSGNLIASLNSCGKYNFYDNSPFCSSFEAGNTGASSSNSYNDYPSFEKHINFLPDTCENLQGRPFLYLAPRNIILKDVLQRPLRCHLRHMTTWHCQWSTMTIS